MIENFMFTSRYQINENNTIMIPNKEGSLEIFYPVKILVPELYKLQRELKISL